MEIIRKIVKILISQE